MQQLNLTLLSAFIFLMACASGRVSLKPYEKEKLDPALQNLVINKGKVDSSIYNKSTNREGETVFDVIIRSDDPEAVRKAGIPVQSVVRNIITAQLTVEQIRQAAALDAVTSIQNAAKHYPNN